MTRPSSRRIQGLFDRTLRDPYEEILRSLGGGRALAFSRFGDGEFEAIFNPDDQAVNCDGHPYYRDLGLRLEQIVRSEPTYLMGLQPLAVVAFGAKPIRGLAAGTDWVLSECLHDALEERRLDRFFDALVGRRTLLVGPEHLHDLALAKGWRHLVVPSSRCWLAYGETRERLKSSIAATGDVVLFCASMMSNVLIDDLVALAPGNAYVDVGSVFDPYCGVGSRDYHRLLNRELVDSVRAESV